MNINKQVVDQLSRWFVRRDKDTTFGGHLLPSAESTYNIGSSDRRVNVLYARAVVADNLGTTEGGGIGNADTVDGYDASSTPTANTLLPLDGSAQFPTSVYPNALLVDGSRTLTGNLSVNAGITIDGVDISAHASNTDAHHSRSHGITSSSDHTVTGTTQQLVGLTGTNTLGLLTPTSQPGASSQILKTDSDGAIRLERLGIKNAPSAYYNIYSIQNTTAPGTSMGGILNTTMISDTSTYFNSGIFILEQTQTTGSNSLALTNILSRYVHNTTSDHSGTITNVQAELYSYSTGDVSNLIDFLAGGGYNQTGNTSVGSRFGIKIQNLNFPMTGTQYGLQVDNLTSGNANYAIYTGSGKVQLGDTVGIKISPVDNTGLYVYQLRNGVVNSHIYGAHIQALSSDFQSAYSLTGLYVQSYFQDTNNSSLNSVGGELSVMHSTGATLLNATGVYTNAYLYSGGEYTNWYGFQVGGGFFPSGGSIGNRRAVYVAPPATNVVNNYGLLVDDQRNATGSTYSIYAGGGDIYLAYGDMILNTIDIETSNYESQTTGWAIGYDGSADFRTIYADEMHVQAFIAEIYEAFVGAIIVTKSKGRLSRNFTIPSTGNSGTIYFEDLEGWDDTQLFASSDYILLRYIDMSGGGLIVTDVWGTVSAYSDLGGGEQSYTFTTTDDGGVSSSVIYAGAIALDYGQSGSGSQGTWEATVLDVDSPYSQVRTWTTNPWTPANWTTHLRLGNLEGITSTLEYGLWAGQGTGSTDTWILLSDQNAEIHNMPLKINDGSNDTILLEPSTPYFSIGSTAPTSYSSGSGIWMGKDSSTFKFRVGNPSGIRFAWDGTDVYVGGSAEYVKVSSSGLSLYGNSTEVIKLDTSGNAIFGQVATDQGNMYWNATTKQLEFRGGTGGTIVQAYVDTDGTIAAGQGMIRLTRLGEIIYRSGIAVDAQISSISKGGLYFVERGTAYNETITSYSWVLATSAVSSELISNTGWETNTSNWTMTAQSEEDAEYGRETTSTAPEGSYVGYINLSHGDIVDWDHAEIYSNTWSASSGDRFVVSFWFRTSYAFQLYAKYKSSVWVEWETAGTSTDRVYLEVGNTGEWRFFYTITDSAPASTTGGTLHIRVDLATTDSIIRVQLDKVSVKKLDNYAGIEFNNYDSSSTIYGNTLISSGSLTVGYTTPSSTEGDILYTGDLLARRGSTNYNGYIYVPVTPTNMIDSSNNTWDFSYSASTGTYTFLNDSYNSWPSQAKALVVLFGGMWASASNSSTMSVRESGGSVNSAQIRAGSADIFQMQQAIIPCDSDGDIEIIVAGATSTASGCRLIGYFI